MAEQDINTLKRVGKIASEVREFGKKLIKPGVKYLEVADKVEAKILKLGAIPAFPCNISVNSVAAHHVPSFGETAIFKEGDIVKLDLGACIDGWLSDTAVSIVLSDSPELHNLSAASKNALDAAIKKITPGITVSEIGRTISDEITALGFQPIKNLTGHLIERWNLHAGLAIPNFDTKSMAKIKEGMLIAIEPFATNGVGLIKNGVESEIFMLEKTAPLRTGRDILKHISDTYRTLPFAKRWLVSKFGLAKTNLFLKEAVARDVLYEYPILMEQDKGIVAQHEHTILVGEKSIVTTS